ncbi:MAG: hypothetical protein A2W07_09175 [candidate division Zixibacteria bacterium RBG_16_43_9]|nr:MAG: hypothetical protein A2W07_09175 [candidate division Zixibacteria bacterium RBG_16_43_9]
MPEYPVKYDVPYPEKSNPWLVLARLFFGWLYIGIPHGIYMGLYGIAAFFVIIYAGLVILFTGNYHRKAFDYLVRYQRYVNRVQAYWLCMVDKYPPFSGWE